MNFPNIGFIDFWSTIELLIIVLVTLGILGLIAYILDKNEK